MKPILASELDDIVENIENYNNQQDNFDEYVNNLRVLDDDDDVYNAVYSIKGGLTRGWIGQHRDNIFYRITHYTEQFWFKYFNRNKYCKIEMNKGEYSPLKYNHHYILNFYDGDDELNELIIGNIDIVPKEVEYSKNEFKKDTAIYKCEFIKNVTLQEIENSINHFVRITAEGQPIIRCTLTEVQK